MAGGVSELIHGYLHLKTLDSDAARFATADTADLWQDMGIVFTGKNMGDLNGVRFSDINGDVSSIPCLCRLSPIYSI